MLKPLLAAALVALSAAPALAQSSKPPLTAEQIYERMCGNILNVLPNVRKDAVAAVPAGADVVLHRVCTGVQLNSFGNVVGLGHTIAANPALSAALSRWGYRADDVVGIRIDGDTVQLYVHRA